MSLLPRSLKLKSVRVSRHQALLPSHEPFTHAAICSGSQSKESARPKQTKSILFWPPEGIKLLHGRNERGQRGGGEKTQGYLERALQDFRGDWTGGSGSKSLSGPTDTAPFDFQILQPPLRLALFKFKCIWPKQLFLTLLSASCLITDLAELFPQVFFFPLVKLRQ